MTMFLNIAVGSSAIVAAYVIVGILRNRLYINGATAAMLCAMAFAATGGGEFVREGVRKPYSVRNILYSNAVRPEQVASVRVTGLTVLDPYPLRHANRLPTLNGEPHPDLKLGALTYRDQCSICHTIVGANALLDLAGTWDADMRRQNFAKLQHLKPFMPPFCGNAEELEALVQYLAWEQQKRPNSWPDPNADPAARRRQLDQIQKWLDAAGTAPASGHPNMTQTSAKGN